MSAHNFPVQISPNLLETSLECAKLQAEDIGSYAVGAVRLLNFATEHRFSLSTTTLVVPEVGRVRLPSLRDASDRPFSERVPIQLESNEYDRLAVYASRAGITITERVRRSLRLANFLVRSEAMPEPMFRKLGEIRPVMYRWQT